MKKRHLLFFAILTTITACTKPDEAGWITYTIKAGHHRPEIINDLTVRKHEVNFYFEVDPTWLNADGIPAQNKIYGFSEGHHHTNSSARLSFTCQEGQIRIGGYCWVDGTEPTEENGQRQEFMTVQPGEIHACKIRNSNGKFEFFIDGAKVWETASGIRANQGYILGPFIGGQETANKDIKFRIAPFEDEKMKF